MTILVTKPLHPPAFHLYSHHFHNIWMSNHIPQNTTCSLILWLQATSRTDCLFCPFYKPCYRLWLVCETNSKWSIQTPEWIQSIFGKTCIPVRIFSVSIVICPVYHSWEKKYRTNRMFVLYFSILFNLNLVKRTFAIRFRYLLMNAVALRPVSGSYNYDTNDNKCRFQSTLPRGKWRKRCGWPGRECRISIHTSAREVTCYVASW